ncbi:CTTNBP2 N-terminal-like protein isoform X1 [Suricata suricatta]|nr:CTTNBP2 N-terminal-like protein isoform X1 [Suricata suricatta]XP_029804409.1 CTTNBP2 N-terminal-like protein isoform X1 [Suricata suricatta]XP_029804410.1 CTTNBP2 N-terminal-like protein isoform X1 [Suricata suricatta]XP_029804411.1 CTTNBP2 N-terminal-like protein isoform X1 [Suricata suricatta]XP_029804412.1 CTTNBP2 N-terminal-like protein isoform X1 [Suricata suricatta]
MNLEKLSKPELLTLFSILEGELEARDLVIEALKAQHRDTFIEERYGKYNISDPLMALQRDFETLKEKNDGEKQPVCTNPLSVLKAVIKQCKAMQEHMLSQLAAAESRHRKVILDLEEERQRHAQDTAEGDDVTYMLEKERERLTQQLEFEKSQVKKFEKEQKRLSSQLEEERSRHKQLSSVLVLECKKATSKAAEEGQRAGELSRKLEKEKGRVCQLEEELAAERRRGLQTEARVEKQLSEFDIEREQLRAKLNREENRTRTLKEEMESLKKIVKDLEASHQHGCPTEQSKKPVTVSQGTATEPPVLVSVFCQTEGFQAERTHGSNAAKVPTAGPPAPTTPTYSYAKTNGHFEPEIQTAKETVPGSVVEPQVPARERSVGLGQERAVENGGCAVGLETPVPAPGHLPSGGGSLSPSSTASSSLTSSPCSSPVLTKRLLGSSASSPGYQSSYQVGINQRFHAARHKFQSQADQDQQASGLQSPPSRDLSPTLLDNSAAKQLARNTVTQVLSRFTSQQGPIKAVSPNSSPFGTDYRNLASTTTSRGDTSHSPTPGKVSSPLSPLSPGIKSPTIPRAERGHPPPIPPKKPGLTPSPSTTTPLTKTPSQASSLATTEDLASSCSSNAVVANGKDVEILLPTSS